MDRTIPLTDILQWEVRSWSRAFPLWQRYLPTQRPAAALGIGEREGGLSLWLASQGFDVVCSDLHTFPPATTQLHERYGVQRRITYKQADATALPFPDGCFDVVIFKSVIGALSTRENQRQAILEMHRVLRPGGVLLFAENLIGTRLHVALRRRFVHWNSYWRYLHHARDRDLFAPFARLDDATTGFMANLGRSESQRDLLARFDGLVMPLVPQGMRTIWYGAAIKG